MDSKQAHVQDVPQLSKLRFFDWESSIENGTEPIHAGGIMCWRDDLPENRKQRHRTRINREAALARARSEAWKRKATSEEIEAGQLEDVLMPLLGIIQHERCIGPLSLNERDFNKFLPAFALALGKTGALYESLDGKCSAVACAARLAGYDGDGKYLTFVPYIVDPERAMTEAQSAAKLIGIERSDEELMQAALDFFNERFPSFDPPTST